MCYDALVDGDVTERPVSTLLREETPDALVNGAMAAVIVVSVLFASGGVGAATVVGTAVAAAGLGAVVHQAVLLVGVGFLRYRARDATNAGVERPV